MKLEFDVDVDGSQQDALSTLRATLSGVGAATSNEGLATALARCAASDTLTWLADGPPGTVSAWREHRLVTIADLIFEGGMPSEAFVAELFSLTSGEARSLIRRTLARHRRQMSATVRRGLLMAVEQGQVVGRKNARRYYLTMEPAVLGYANDLLSRHPDGLEPIVRREEGINRFEIGIASMTVIVDALGLSLDAVGRGRTRRSS